MTDTLNLYKGEELINSAEYVEGKAKITLSGLKSDTNYPAGTYQITKQNENGESAKVDVPSFKTKPISVTGVIISPKTANVNVGDTIKLTSTVTPSTATNNNVTYRSSAEQVAEVSDDGTVNGLTAGQTTITVQTEDGNKTDTSIVTVNAVSEEG